MTLDPATDLVLSRKIAAPRRVLWDCWTSPQHIQQFFVPRPHKVVHCEIDLRVGGRFNTVFDVDGTQMDNKGVFLEVVDGRKLVFTDTYTEGWKPAPDPFMTAIIEFLDEDASGTEYRATVRHRTPEARQTHEDMGSYGGWGTVAPQLEDYARGL